MRESIPGSTHFTSSKLLKISTAISQKTDIQIRKLGYPLFGGGERDRTDDLLLAKQALSQLSYTPVSGDRNQASGARNNPDPWRLIADP